MHRAKVIREDYAFILWLTFRQPLPRMEVLETGLKSGDFSLRPLLRVKTIAQISMIAIMLCFTALSVDISYDFKCKSNDRNSTLIQYSHLRDSGTLAGYEASSFNYLSNGQIEFEDTIECLQRWGKDEGNSYIYRNTDVFFDGENSISDFYAKGFYPDSNAISSRKKLWSNVFNGALVNHSWMPLISKNLCVSSLCSIADVYYNPQNDSRSSIMRLNAEVAMGSIGKRDASYDLMYNAAILDGVFSATDTAGLADNMGIKGVYWEQNVLLKGNIALRNGVELW